MKKTTILAAAVAALAISQTAVAESKVAPGAQEQFCAMTKAQGEVQGSLLGSAEVFTNLGDPSTGSKAVTVGVRKSLSRTLQAGTVAKLAEAQCEAFRLEEKLSQQADRVEQRSELHALRILEPKLRSALETAEQNVAQEEKLLAAKTSTVADLRGAYEQVEQIRTELAAAVRRQGQLVSEVADEETSLEALAYEANAARSKVAELSSKLTAQSGWDVALVAGGRTNSDGRERTGAFVAVTATMNLGMSAANEAASRVYSLSQEFLAAQRDGGVQSLIRARDTVRGVLVGEEMALESLVRRQSLLIRTKARLQDVDTTDGLRLQRTLKVEAEGVDARAAAARARIEYLQNWLAQNA